MAQIGFLKKGLTFTARADMIEIVIKRGELMKTTKIASLALAFVLSVSGAAGLVTMTTHADGDPVDAGSEPVAVDLDAADPGEPVDLASGIEDYLETNTGSKIFADWIRTGKITLANTSAGVYNLTLNEDITATLDSSIRFINGVVVNLNLNGCSLTGQILLDVANATLNISGRGTIAASSEARVGGSNSTIRVYGNATSSGKSVLTVGSDVTIGAAGDKHYGVAIFQKLNESTKEAYGVNVTISGKVLSEYGVASNGTINYSDAVITISDGAVISATDNPAIYAAGLATWNIGAATLSGPSGIGIKAGTLNLNGTTITATQAYTDVDLYSNGIYTNGSVIQIEDNDSYIDTITINVNGGNYSATGDGGYVFFEYNKSLASDKSDAQKNRLQKLTINGGNFAGKGGIIKLVDDNSSAAVINGGAFSTSNDEQVSYIQSRLSAGKYLMASSGQYIVRTVSSSSSSSSASRPSTSVETPSTNTVTNVTTDTTGSSDSTVSTVVASDATSDVQISADSKDVAEGSSFVVNDVKTDPKVVSQVASGEALVGAFDLKLVAADGRAITKFSRGLTVRVPVSNSYSGETNLYARYVDTDGNAPESDIHAQVVAKDGKYYAEFEVSHFSTYMLVRTTSPRVVAAAGTGSGSAAASQPQASTGAATQAPNTGALSGTTSAASDSSWIFWTVILAGLGAAVVAVRKFNAARAKEA